MCSSLKVSCAKQGDDEFVRELWLAKPKLSKPSRFKGANSCMKTIGSSGRALQRISSLNQVHPETSKYSRESKRGNDKRIALSELSNQDQANLTFQGVEALDGSRQFKDPQQFCQLNQARLQIEADSLHSGYLFKNEIALPIKLMKPLQTARILRAE